MNIFFKYDTYFVMDSPTFYNCTQDFSVRNDGCWVPGPQTLPPCVWSNGLTTLVWQISHWPEQNISH